MSATPASAAQPSWTTRLIPPVLRGYRRSWLRADIVAGLTLAAVAIPETMGYTSIAQVPVITGLYTVLFPAVLFALLGSSRLLVVGADSATAAILAGRPGRPRDRRAQPNSPQWLAMGSADRSDLRRAAHPGPAAEAGVPRRLLVGLRADRLPHRCRHPGAHRPDPRHARGSPRDRAAGSSSSGDPDQPRPDTAALAGLRRRHPRDHRRLQEVHPEGARGRSSRWS